ncbi:DNA-binding protein [Papillibacter cinnamivorans]|uniref:N(6)-L-threonylcarbamoyladenine synthase n=1 Tax=Papillibacter cinnamivorans DSM 12816 TaxID=1122930 RepID=A0A1W2CJV3_9FIRM|nr:DNA-binding protein [Papillibacter cinnamivorans]SMC85517.1 N6-L-threonylcarbamoyladenine synthase [Papillibacter cinnamivorans DSM 12816]
MKACLGLDTSNYRTSAALFGAEGHRQAGRLLPVPEGDLGLRQSDALFLHLKALPEVLEELLGAGFPKEIRAAGASTQPRRAEGSYMPCFLAGETLGRGIALSMGIPFFSFSHQEGHLAAAAWSSGHEELLDRPFLAWHLSGGTTELLYVTPREAAVSAERIGGTEDLAAGQLIDRTGKLLGMRFPAGQELDALAEAAEKDIYFTPRLRGLEFSLSGLENKVHEQREAGRKPEEIARFAVSSVAAAAEAATKEALRRYPGLPVLFSGGVSSSRVLRERLREIPGAIFAPAEFSGDNAAGIALLSNRALARG